MRDNKSAGTGVDSNVGIGIDGTSILDDVIAPLNSLLELLSIPKEEGGPPLEFCRGRLREALRRAHALRTRYPAGR
jgi:hypothetical protein